MTANTKIFERLGKTSTTELTAASVIGPVHPTVRIGKKTTGSRRADGALAIKHV